MAAARKDDSSAKARKGDTKRKKKDKDQLPHAPRPDAPRQLWGGPALVTAYGSAVIKMVGYRNDTTEWWGMCKNFRLDPGQPGASVSRTITKPTDAPEITNAVQFVAWALPILQENNPGDPSFDWEMCTIQSI